MEPPTKAVNCQPMGVVARAMSQKLEIIRKKGIAPPYNAKTMENGVSQEPEAGAMDPASRFQVLRQEPWTWREPGAKGLAEGIGI